MPVGEPSHRRLRASGLCSNESGRPTQLSPAITAKASQHTAGTAVGNCENQGWLLPRKTKGCLVAIHPAKGLKPSRVCRLCVPPGCQRPDPPYIITPPPLLLAACQVPGPQISKKYHMIDDRHAEMRTSSAPHRAFGPSTEPAARSVTAAASTPENGQPAGPAESSNGE